MIKPIRHSSKLVLVVLVLLLSTAACKSKKKAMEAAAAEKARMEQEAALRKQKEEEEARKREAEERAKREAEARDREAREANARANSPQAKLGQYFDMIASSNSVTSANGSISEALALFASPQTPVLIVISESGGQKDYDRPTTIKDYLNYLKDQKKNANKISNLQFDSSGKITEVELRKN
jgi:transcription initiation factor TFIID subunit TAF12